MMISVGVLERLIFQERRQIITGSIVLIRIDDVPAKRNAVEIELVIVSYDPILVNLLNQM